MKSGFTWLVRQLVALIWVGLITSFGGSSAIAAAKAPEVLSAGGGVPPVQTVDYVDLTRYAGKWYQIAFFPTRFQGSCTIDTTATYGVREDGKVSVFNECKTPSGKYRSIKGTATISDHDSNAKLRVKFFWFAPAGDYWILDLDQDYQTALVGSPNRKFLWILSRKPQISKALYQELQEKAQAQHFDIQRLQLTSELLPNS
jgi:apolipoprotein D and lipocalin family protein